MAPTSGEVEIIDHSDYVEARYLGSYSLQTYLKQMEQSVRACEERTRDFLLVDITALTGYRPSVMERHEIGTTGAALSRGLEKVAVVVLPDQIPEKQAGKETYATTVARNRGLEVEAFLDRNEAIRWLRS